MRACLLSRQNLADISGKWRQRGFGCFARSPSRVPSASETTKGRGAPVADASRAGARDDSRNLEDAWGDQRRVRARARARVRPDASASATPFTANQPHGRVPFRGRPTRGGGDFPPRGHLPARRARARPRPRPGRRDGRRRARAPSRGARAGRFQRRGPPRAPSAGVSGRDGEERRRRFFFSPTRRTRKVFDERRRRLELSLERTLRGRRLRSAHDRSRESPAVPQSRSRRARAAVFTRPPADVHVFRSVHVRAPLGVLLRAGSFEGRSERSSAADRLAFASADRRGAVASAVTARLGAVRRPAGRLHVRRLA